MIIEKNLKNISFLYNSENKSLELVNNKGKIADTQAIRLSKTEMFSLSRFIIRIAQYEGRKHRNPSSLGGKKLSQEEE